MNAHFVVDRSISTAWPAYLALLDSGELERRVTEAYVRLEECDLWFGWKSAICALVIAG